MNIKSLIDIATDKDKFLEIEDYISFCSRYLEYIKTNLQAVIVSKNENNYRFFQYKGDASYNVTRPINSNLMINYELFGDSQKEFLIILDSIRDVETRKQGELINNLIYTCQQSIGATLDALPANKSNKARKINGDLFERFVQLLIKRIGVDVSDGTVNIPVVVDGNEVCKMRYQHDLIIEHENKIRAIGSVKTSTKDRIDKIFIDKFLHNKLTEKDTPHFAIVLNDVQRKGREGKYGINATFLSGRFQGYTVKLSPLDGVYYVDIRPNMQSDSFLQDHIKTFDKFLTSEIWEFMK